MGPGDPTDIENVAGFLDLHHGSFYASLKYAEDTRQPAPSDTRAWSQILVSLLTGIKGRSRKKGSDLSDGSDVKAANAWEAIDTPRFNGCIPGGGMSSVSKKDIGVDTLDDIPYLFFVMWDHQPETYFNRCRIWCVRAKSDPIFRNIASRWYQERKKGTIISNNFQLHPPRNQSGNEMRNKCGNFLAPLFFEAVKRPEKGACVVTKHNPETLHKDLCGGS